MLTKPEPLLLPHLVLASGEERMFSVRLGTAVQRPLSPGGEWWAHISCPRATLLVWKLWIPREGRVGQSGGKWSLGLSPS